MLYRATLTVGLPVRSALSLCGQSQKHFTSVTYSPGKIRWIIQCEHAPMQCFQNSLAYLAMAENYTCKMFKQWGGIICKHNARWQHVSRLKAIAISSS